MSKTRWVLLLQGALYGAILPVISYYPAASLAQDTCVIVDIFDESCGSIHQTPEETEMHEPPILTYEPDYRSGDSILDYENAVPTPLPEASVGEGTYSGFIQWGQPGTDFFIYTEDWQNMMDAYPVQPESSVHPGYSGSGERLGTRLAPAIDFEQGDAAVPLDAQ